MIARLLLLLLLLLFPPLAAPWAIPLGVAQEGGARPAPAIVLKGEAESERAPHGGGNVYAPDVHRVGGGWRMWYGGQGRDGHDRIHLAESRDGTRWEKRGVVLDNGGANHVNDPSVVRAGGQWWMFYTVAESAEDDAIAAATSMDGIRWEKRGVVLAPGAGEAWDSRKVGRPSALYDAGRFRLWFDGQPTDQAAAAGDLAAAVKREGRAVGYAESTDGLTWQRRGEPVLRGGAGAIHVARLGSRYVMAIESGGGTRWASSGDGLRWNDEGWLLAKSNADADRFGHVTPFVLPDLGGGQGATLFFGAARRKTWDGNAIASMPVRLRWGAADAE